MHNLENLKALAKFEAKSALASEDAQLRKKTLLQIAQNVAERNQGKTVAQMLNSVLALSSQTRRVLQKPVQIDLDVFNADGSRAVVLELGSKE